jgi:cytochrome c biogenesis protein CcdA
LWLVLGASVVKSSPVFGSLVTLMFTFGFTLPVGAIMLGVNLGAISSLGRKFTKPIQTVGGVVLIAMGFMLLAS